VELEALPLHDVSGKVDRKRLPDPPARVAPRSSGVGEPVRNLSADASRSEKEALLARARRDSLKP
jgi:hypothetical protein